MQVAGLQAGRLHSCKVRGCRLQGFRLQAVRLQAERLQVTGCVLQAASPRATERKCSTGAFRYAKALHVSRASPWNEQNPPNEPEFCTYHTDWVSFLRVGVAGIPWWGCWHLSGPQPQRTAEAQWLGFPNTPRVDGLLWLPFKSSDFVQALEFPFTPG